MRVLTPVVALLCVLLAARPAPAQEADMLRREIEGLRAQLQSLSERLQRLETQPPPAPAISVTDLARPREPFALYERRGPGQLLFDVGIVTDFTGGLTRGNVEHAKGGTFAGRENRFFPREVELNLFGRIDPYADGHFRFEFAEEFEDGTRETKAALAEAYLTLLTLPFGTRLSLGQVPVRFGLLSHLHREALPQPDPPQVLTRFLGEEQFREAGAELAWVAPTPFYLETVVGVFNGDNEVAASRSS